MDELFGIPAGRLTLVLLGVFAVGALILAVQAARDRTSFRIAVRNIPRRKTQTTLIVVGLMLATLLFSAAFTTGDTLTSSLRTQALENIGRVDVVLKAEQPESNDGTPFGPGAGGPAVPSERERYFDESLAGKIQDRLDGDESVAGVAPLARETVPVTSPETDLSEPAVDVLGMNADSMKGFDDLRTASGKTLGLRDLEQNEIYLSAKTAEGLGVGVGDEIEASLVRPTTRPEKPPEPASRRRPGAPPQGPPGGLRSGSLPAGLESQARSAEPAGEARAARPEGQQSSPRLEVAGVYVSGAH